MFAMRSQVCPRGREPRWEVTLGNRLYGAYLDKHRALPDAVDAAREPCRRVTRPKSGSAIDRLQPGSSDYTGEAAMHVVIGPVLTRARGYAFDSRTPEDGLTRG